MDTHVAVVAGVIGSICAVAAIAVAYRVRQTMIAPLCGNSIKTRRQSLVVELELGPVYPGAEPIALEKIVPGHSSRIRKVHALLASNESLHLGSHQTSLEGILVQPPTPTTPQSGILVEDKDVETELKSASHEWILDVPQGGFRSHIGIILAPSASGRSAIVTRLSPGGIAFCSHGQVLPGDTLVTINGRPIFQRIPGDDQNNVVSLAKERIAIALHAASICGGTVRVGLARRSDAPLPMGPRPPTVK